MTRKQRTVHLSLLLTVILSSRIARGDTTCYDTWGAETPDLVPCGSSNSSQPSSCCSKDDYCLSNGLCLSTSVSNLFTQQGCTDKQWIKPCSRICRAESGPLNSKTSVRKRDEAPENELDLRNNTTSNIGVALLPCANSLDNQGGVKYCCGNEPSDCCQSSKGSIIPPATIIRGIDHLPSPTQTNSGALAGSAGSTTSSPVGGPNQNPTTTPETSSAEQATSYALKVGVGVGLGIGIPILIMLIIMVVILLRQYRRSRNAEISALAGPRTMTPFRMVDTRRSSTVGSLHRHMSTRTTRAGPLEDWPPSNMEWGSPSTMSDRGVLLSPVLPLQRPLSPTPLAEMDGERQTPRPKPKVEQVELPLGVNIE